VSFRVRLALLYTGLMATALVLFSVLGYAAINWTVIRTVDDNLERTAVEVSRFFQIRKSVPPLDNLSDASTFVMVRTVDDAIDHSSNLRDFIFPLPEKARQGEVVFSTERDANNYYRLMTLPVLVDGKPLFYVQVAYLLGFLEGVTEQLRLPIFLGTMLFLGLSAWAAWLVARRAMLPIEEVARAAEAVGESADLSLRVPYDGPADEVGALVGTFNDMLDQLEGLYTRLSASIDAQQRFVADASHELRTPLTIIRGNIDYMQKAGVMDHEALGDMASEAQRMTFMIEELLTMARADAGQSFELEPLALGPLVAEACRKAQALPHTVEFHTELPEALGRVVVLGHQEWLVRIILILIDNAFKYTPSGTVTVRAGRQNDGLVIQVQDTGQGISREDLPHVFERFYRADRSRSRGGTGLGLAIAQWAAGVHGGSLSVDSEPGVGSTFSLWLPLHRNPS